MSNIPKTKYPLFATPGRDYVKSLSNEEILHHYGLSMELGDPLDFD